MLIFTLNFSKLRSSTHGQLLAHLCFALIGLYISFTISAFMGRFYVDVAEAVREPLCITSSAFVHYFLLVYFSVTVGQSMLLYFKLVKVLGTLNLLIQYPLKVGIVSWSKSDIAIQFYVLFILISPF